MKTTWMNVWAACALAGLALGGGCQMRSGEGGLSDEQVRLDRAVDLVAEARAAQDAGRRDEAIGLLREATTVYPSFYASWNNLGALLAEKQENMEAVAAFKMAGDLSPTDARPHTNIGMVWQRLGYLDVAAEAYSEAIRRDRNYLPALRQAVLIDTQRDTASEESVERCKRALLLETDPVWKADLLRRKMLLEQRMASQRESPARP